MHQQQQKEAASVSHIICVYDQTVIYFTQEARQHMNESGAD